MLKSDQIGLKMREECSRLKKVFGVLFAVTLAGCASGTYTPPAALDATAMSNERVVNKSYGATWDSLIDYASGTFFAIDNFEKASGLLTLSFGSADPSKYIDCGQFQAQQGARKVDMPYVDYLKSSFNASLQGKMNIVVRSIGPNKTSVKVNARYVFSYPSSQAGSGQTWTFDSGSQATVIPSNAISGSITTRTCRPTYFAEKSILEAIKR